MQFHLVPVLHLARARHDDLQRGRGLDLEFTVIEIVFGRGIAVDKNILNQTNEKWSQIEFILGAGLGDEFMPSNGVDDLYVIIKPRPDEITGEFLDLDFDGNSVSEPDTVKFSGLLDPNDLVSF